MLKSMFRNRKGQGLVEYALIVGGVAVTCALAITVFGMKTSEMLAGYAGLLPGANADTNANINQSGLFELSNANGQLQLDMDVIVGEVGQERLNIAIDPAGDNGIESYVTNNRITPGS